MEEKIFKVLKKAKIFTNIDENDIKEFITECSIVNFPKKYRFTNVEIELNIFIPISGSVKGYQVNPRTGKLYILFIFDKGDVFDVVNFIDHRNHEIIWETVEDTQLLKVPYNILELWVENSKQINKNILFILSHMLQNLEQNASDLALYDTLNRLSRLILRHLPGKAHLVDDVPPRKVKLKFLNNLSHDTIAHMTGTVREVVSRHIKTLKNEEVIETNKKKQYLVNLRNLLEKTKL